MTDLLQSQLTDPFRIVMLIALVYVWNRTRAVSGTIAPLAAGWAFVAVLLPLTTAAGLPLVPSIGVGLVSNAIILAVALAGWALAQRLQR